MFVVTAAWCCRPVNTLVLMRSGHAKHVGDRLQRECWLSATPKSGFATIAVLDTRRMRFEHEAAPVRVHERMPRLRPLIFFPAS